MTRSTATPALIFCLLLLLGPPGVGAQAAASPEVDRAAASISAADVESRLRVIAHDSMRGRDTPSPELEETARWVAGRFQSFGLEPGGDEGGYLQRYPIQTIAADFDASSARVRSGPRLEFGTDLGFPFGATREGDFTGGVVVVSGSEGWAEVLGAADLDGKHVILVSSPAREGAWSGAARRMSRMIRRSSGPASLLVATARSDAEWASVVRRQRESTRVRIGTDGAGRTPVVEIRDRALTPLLAERGMDIGALRERFDRELRVESLEGLTLTLSPRTRVVEETSAPNTVGILPGGDPELRDEYVVFSAHMDHVGVGTPDASGDSIYNGADDDGSGTVTVVELAEAFSRLDTPPRRSMIFVTVSGEEKGLWGSEYFAAHPPVPVERMVADLNMDMVGRNWSDTIVAIGRQHSELGRILERVNGRHPELNMTAVDDLWPEQSFYTRSDHFNFARRGVPVLFFFNGTHEDYHEPGDEVGKIDFDKTARIGRLIFYLGLEVANRDRPPRWDPQSYEAIVGSRR